MKQNPVQYIVFLSITVMFAVIISTAFGVVGIVVAALSNPIAKVPTLIILALAVSVVSSVICAAIVTSKIFSE